MTIVTLRFKEAEQYTRIIGILARRKFSLSSIKSGILFTARNNFSDFMIN
jgi:hypothetical protein